MIPKMIRAFVLAAGFEAIGFLFQTATADTFPNINEFVADHAGADSSEYVEVWGPFVTTPCSRSWRLRGMGSQCRNS